MPAAIPAIAAAVSAFASSAVGTAIGKIIVGTVIAAGLGFAARALAPKPKPPDLSGFSSAASGQTTSVRQPISVHDVVYGETRKGGAIVGLFSTENNRYHHLVVALAAHEVEEIGTVFFNDYPIPIDHLDGSGAVTAGRFSGKARIKKHLGSDSQTADADLVSEVSEWTTDHRLRGIAYVYVRFDFDRNVYPNGLPNISAVLKGKKVFDTRDSANKWIPNPALCVRDYLTDTQYGKGAASTEINDTKISADANTCEEFVTVSQMSHEVASVNLSENAFEVDVKNMKVQTGDRVQLTTTGTLPSGFSLATNYYVIVWRDQGTDDFNAGVKLASSYANALAGTAVTPSDTGSGTHTVTKHAEPRYTCNGTFKTSRTPHDILTDLLTSMAGRLPHIGDKWRLVVGAYTAPTVSLNSSHLNSGIKVQTRVSRRDRFNAVKGVYVSPLHDWQPQDYPPVTNSTYEANDGGVQIPGELDLPFTTRPQTAQRLAKIELERNRLERTFKASFNLNAFQVQAGDTVQFSYDRFSWSNKVFEVMESSLAVDEDEGGNPIISVPMTLRETASTIYDFDESTEEETVDPNDAPSQGSALNPAPPTALTITEEIYITRDGAGVKTRAIVGYTASVDAFVEHYIIEYKVTTDSVWTVLPKTRATTVSIDDIDPDIYDFRVKSVNDLGVAGDYTATKTKELTGLLDPPTAPQNLTVSAVGGMAVLRWDETTDVDVLIGGTIFFRHDNDQTGAGWSTSVSIGKTLPGNTTQAVLPLKPGTYLARFLDSSGIESDTATVSTKQATAITYTNISAISEHTSFPGTKTNVAYDAGGQFIHLEGTDNIDTWGAVDDIVDWDSAGGIVSSGTYEFAASFDFGSVVQKRLTVLISNTIVNTLDLIDARTENIDDWADFDGSDSGDADAWVEARHTDDNPAGTPTWSTWERVDSGEYDARAFQFRLRMESYDPAFNIQVDELTVTSDEVS